MAGKMVLRIVGKACKAVLTQGAGICCAHSNSFPHKNVSDVVDLKQYQDCEERGVK